MKNKKDFELDLLLAVDELLYEVNVRFGGIPILREMKEREYFQDAKDDETVHGLIEKYKITKNENNMLRYADRPAEPEYYANLIEEIADVEIMLYQLKVMFNISDDEVFAFKVEKAKREQERLKKL